MLGRDEELDSASTLREEVINCPETSRLRWKELSRLKLKPFVYMLM